MKIPVLLIVFKRCDTALKALEPIRRARPERIYIAADGPREGVAGEGEATEATRKAVLDAIDWPCEVKTLLRKENLGCSRGVYTAINWLFENEEEGIIVEDDCVLRDSFFPFVEEMLERYRDDRRVAMVDAANYLPKVAIPDSYGFSRFKSTNGWATWRRAWALMDMDMKWRGTEYELSVIRNMGYGRMDILYWRYRMKAVDAGDVSAWDWQWYFTMAAHNMLGIYPRVSLVTNIGFGEGATHTSSAKMPEHYISHHELELPLRHPEYVVPFEPFEKAFYRLNNTPFEIVKRQFPLSVKNYIKRLVRR